MKSDLRIVKTHKALIAAIISLLNRKNFNQVTVNDICEEAYVSRATFYTHFNDKYDLFRYYLDGIQKEIIKDVYNYEELEEGINNFVDNNKKSITNVFKDANSETMALIHSFMQSIAKKALKRKSFKSKSHTLLLNFCVGGMTQQMMWLVNNNFPEDYKMMNQYFYKMMENITDWDAKQEKYDTERG